LGGCTVHVLTRAASLHPEILNHGFLGFINNQRTQQGLQGFFASPSMAGKVRVTSERAWEALQLSCRVPQQQSYTRFRLLR
jgi:hypothetical protein